MGALPNNCAITGRPQAEIERTAHPPARSSASAASTIQQCVWIGGINVAYGNTLPVMVGLNAGF
jgi:hypothetical protein